MQLTAIFVAALSASTLTAALPTEYNSTDSYPYEAVEQGIQKRDTFGWLSNFGSRGKLLIHQTFNKPDQLTHL